jgi:hypothetical protein
LVLEVTIPPPRRFLGGSGFRRDGFRAMGVRFGQG